MKVRDVVPDIDVYKVLKIVNHIKKKKKSNPKLSKSTKLGSFIDVFGSMTGYSDPGSKGTVDPNINP